MKGKECCPNIKVIFQLHIYIPEIICTISGDISIRLMFKFLYDAYIVYCKYTCVRVRVPRFQREISCNSRSDENLISQKEKF